METGVGSCRGEDEAHFFQCVCWKYGITSEEKHENMNYENNREHRKLCSVYNQHQQHGENFFFPNILLPQHSYVSFNFTSSHFLNAILSSYRFFDFMLLLFSFRNRLCTTRILSFRRVDIQFIVSASTLLIILIPSPTRLMNFLTHTLFERVDPCTLSVSSQSYELSMLFI